MLWRMRLRALNLNKAFRANRLIAASRPIQVRRVVQETDGTFPCIFVEICLDRLSIDKWVWSKLEFPRC